MMGFLLGTLAVAFFGSITVLMVLLAVWMGRKLWKAIRTGEPIFDDF